jgi:hypothetical protein
VSAGQAWPRAAGAEKETPAEMPNRRSPGKPAGEVGSQRQYFGAKKQEARWKLAHVKPSLGPVYPAGAQINMPDRPIIIPAVPDSQYFRDLAAKARAKADQELDDEAHKQLLLRIAETYERVADRVERRSRDAEKSK